jgi:hypothetical protein
VLICSFTYLSFIVFYTLQMYHFMLSRAMFSAVGRYTIGYLELAMLASVVAGVAAVRALRPSGPRIAASVGLYLVLGFLVLLVARPWAMTGYSVSFAAQDGSARMLMKDRVIPGSAMSFQGSEARIAKARGRGRDGSFPDEKATGFVANAPEFVVTATLPANGRNLAEKRFENQPNVCLRHSILVSADRAVSVAIDRSNKATFVQPYQLVRLPVTLTGPLDADKPITLKLHIALNENPVDWVRHRARKQTHFFVYGLLAERCSISNPAPRK